MVGGLLFLLMATADAGGGAPAALNTHTIHLPRGAGEICVPCARKMAEMLARRPEVAIVSADLDTGVVTVFARSGRTLDVGSIERVAAAAGSPW